MEVWKGSEYVCVYATKAKTEREKMYLLKRMEDVMTSKLRHKREGKGMEEGRGRPFHQHHQHKK
jgi:hypothetical protein